MGMMINRRRAYGGKKLPYDDRFVDLGLPSGTLWAKGNIIKDGQGNYSIGNETDWGCYFSWGNIDGHNSGEGYSFNDTNYNASPGSTLTGNISPTDAQHDAAVARLGDGCRLPTKDDFVELFNSAYTTSIWTTQNGIMGRLVTSKMNGNSIFIPAAGFNYGYRNDYADYWSSTFYSTSHARNLNFNSGGVYSSNSQPRYYGFTVRAVK